MPKTPRTLKEVFEEEDRRSVAPKPPIDECPLCKTYLWSRDLHLHLIEHLTSHGVFTALGSGNMEITITCLCGKEFHGTRAVAMMALTQHLKAISPDDLRSHIIINSMCDGFDIKARKTDQETESL